MAKQVQKGVNDLETLYPELAKEWHPTKNGGLLPSEVLSGSRKKVWWQCDKGHEWQATANSRTGNHSNCPVCYRSNLSEIIRKARLNENDTLEKRFPEIAKQWNYEKNDGLKPSDFSPFSGKRVWWKCEKGHEWEVSISSRTSQNSQCPVCRKQSHSSFAEQAVFFYINKAFPDAVNGDRHLGIELDIFIPSINTAIEYDGNVWHKVKQENELYKNAICKQNHVRLIRIREPDLNDYDDCVCLHRETCFGEKSLQNVIIDLFAFLKVEINVDIRLDRHEIIEQYASYYDKRSLGVRFPEIASEWHPTKNGTLTPFDVFAGSNEKVWWLGKCGHEWQASILMRTKDKTSCPYCAKANARVLKGYNDLATLYPTISAEWCYEKNEDLTPDKVTSGSNLKVWWYRKECGHIFQQVIKSRVRGIGCPVCDGKQGRLILKVETGELFETLTKAAESCGKKGISTISSCCLNRKGSRTAYGFHWQYVEKKESSK